MNGTIRAVTGSEVMVDTAVGTLRTRGWRKDWAAGARCTVAVRATLLTLEDGNAADAPVGHIVRTAFQGSSSIMLVDVGGTELVVESLAEGRPDAMATVAVKPAPGVIFALLDD